MSTTAATQIPSLVLASSSPYRRELLARLRIPFTSVSPDLDESPLPGEAPEVQVRRLAEAKARAIATSLSPSLVIGSDQLAVVDGTILAKPGDHEPAVRQLRMMRGRDVAFHTGLCLLNTVAGTADIDCVSFGVKFRNYNDAEIERYLRGERPYQCAGSFMSEGLGISLVAEMRGGDPSALIGLPLIRLAEMLRAAGVPVP